MTILPLCFLLSFCSDWEDISNTRDSVSSAIQTPRISSKILRGASYFQLSSRCLDIPMKHCRSCLIYYITFSCTFSTEWVSIYFHVRDSENDLLWEWVEGDNITTSFFKVYMRYFCITWWNLLEIMIWKSKIELNL